jgi:predicted histone-like DNA-binding protein
MGEIQIQKVQRTVQVKDADNKRKKVQKTYGKIIYRKTLSLDDMAEHIMKHGSVYTEDVVIGVITKLKTCMQEMLADGHKVKLDGIGTLYPTLTSEGVEDAKDYSPSENITRVGIAFLADQSRKSMYKARSMRDAVSLSTKLYSELTGEEGLTPNATPHSQGENPSPSGEGSGNTGSGNTGGNPGGNSGGNTGGGDEPGGDGNDQN